MSWDNDDTNLRKESYFLFIGNNSKSLWNFASFDTPGDHITQKLPEIDLYTFFYSCAGKDRPFLGTDFEVVC